MRRRCTLLCLLAIGCAAAQPAPGPAPQDSIGAAAAAPAPVPAPTQVEVRTLEPFNRVALCAPFTILVEPAAGYQLTIDAQSDVRSAITTLVDTQTLLVEASGFTSLYPVKVTVGLPANQLSAVTNRGAFPGLVAPGFTASKFTATAQGTGPLSVLGLSAQSLVVSNTGTGTVVVTGSYGNATVTSQGSASTYVTGLNTSAVVKSSGVGSVYLNTTSGGVQIVGQTNGVGKVFYSQGACSATSTTPAFVGGAACQQSAVTLPASTTSWTCGLQLTGRAACTGGHASVTRLDNAVCPSGSPLHLEAPGAVESYSLSDSKLGFLLGYDTNTPTQTPPVVIGTVAATGHDYAATAPAAGP